MIWGYSNTGSQAGVERWFERGGKEMGGPA